MTEPTPEEIAAAALAADAEVLAAARRKADTAYSERKYREDEAIRVAFFADDARTYERLIAQRRARVETAEAYNPRRHDDD